MAVKSAVTKTEHHFLISFAPERHNLPNLRVAFPNVPFSEQTENYLFRRKGLLHHVGMFGTAGVFLLGVMVGALVLKIAVNRIREDVVSFPVRHDDEEL